MGELFRSIIDSLPVKGGVRLAIIILAIVSYNGYLKLDHISNRLDQITLNTSAMNQAIVDNTRDISSLQQEVADLK